VRAALGLAGLLAAAALAGGCAAVVVGAGGVAAVNALEDRRTAGSQVVTGVSRNTSCAGGSGGSDASGSKANWRSMAARASVR